mmetsp:Transcript_19591/g.59273  ORF Transcript_19591/g.59273 Transcript_19591/m.59273 type:complete len:204 (+) Transcript_19591:594-1205(+)
MLNGNDGVHGSPPVDRGADAAESLEALIAGLKPAPEGGGGGGMAPFLGLGAAREGPARAATLYAASAAASFAAASVARASAAAALSMARMCESSAATFPCLRAAYSSAPATRAHAAAACWAATRVACAAAMYAAFAPPTVPISVGDNVSFCDRATVPAGDHVLTEGDRCRPWRGAGYRESCCDSGRCSSWGACSWKAGPDKLD